MELPKECKLYRVHYSGDVMVLASSQEEAENYVELDMEKYDLTDGLCYQACEIRITNDEKLREYTTNQYKDYLPYQTGEIAGLYLDEFTIAEIAHLLHAKHVEEEKQKEFLKKQGSLFTDE